VENLKGEALPIQCDVRKETDLQAAVEKVALKWGRIDVVINNAGALWWKDVVDTPMKRYDLINQVNSRATFALTQLCLPYMLKNHYGHIINMSPPIELSMLKGKVAYCISKFGMTLLAHGIGQELKGQGVACNALWPATMVESYATMNFELGNRSMWRKASILSDSVMMILKEDPKSFTGQALIDEDYMRSRGIKNFDKYRCDPNVEPPRLVEFPEGSSHNVGLVSENVLRKNKL